MTRATDANPGPGPSPSRGNGDDGPPTVWGFPPAELHDLLWASRCVQVVRPGSGAASVARGPALYYLLDRDQLVLHPLDGVLKRMHWASPRLVRLRINVLDPQEYTERVRLTDDGVRFERNYGRPVQRSDRAWLTADATLARRWADAPDARRGTRSIREHVGQDALLSMPIEGLSTRATDRGVGEWVEKALSSWRRPNAVISGLYEYQPGVWIHEDARLEPGVRVLGNAWIGSGVDLDAATVLVGPVVLTDAPGSATARGSHPGVAGVDWDLVRSPHWSLPSLTGGTPLRRLLKRWFDIGFSLCVLAATLPLYPLVMLALAIEDGRPFFFAHRRQTLGGREFPCLKFRTMRKDAERIKAELMKQNAADGPQFFMENDPRVTRVGRVLRKYQIDELPQFLNVLAGHMSVVGPRPSPDKENQFCPAWREARLSVRPGVTGLWQVSRTREPQTDFQEWIRYDLEYVQHQSFVGDLRIIFETIRHIAG